MSVPSIIKDALATAKQTIETELAKTLQNIYKLTGIWHCRTHLSIIRISHFIAILLFVIGSPHPPPINPGPLMMKYALINLRQHEAYLKVIMVFINITTLIMYMCSCFVRETY